MPSRAHLTTAILLLGTATTWPSLAVASEADYSPFNPQWQGLSHLFRLAGEDGFGIQAQSKLDWEKLDKHKIVFFIYPTSEIPLKKLITYLRRGGRVILADDFGSSAKLLEQLGVRRVPVNGSRLSRLYSENPALPMATPKTPHPLNDGIPELVTNHPAAFQTQLPAIFAFDPDGGALVVAATLGRGRIVLISDPSIFINRMLKFPTNETFARRLLGYLGRSGEDTFLVFSQSFAETGSPRPAVNLKAPPPPGLSAILADANTLLAEFNEYMLDRTWIMPVATLLSGLLLVLGVWTIPMMRPLYDASWTRPGKGPPPGRFSRDLEPFLNGSPRKMNFAYPAAIYRDVVDARLEDSLGIAAPLATMDEPALTELVRRRAGESAQSLCTQLISLTRRIPSREMVSPYTLTPRYSFKDLRRLVRCGDALLAALRGDNLH